MTDSDWFEVQHFPHAVTMIREPHHDEDVKVYLIEGDRDVAVFDTGLGVGDFAGLVAKLTPRRPRVLQTHAHWDHIGASHLFDDVMVHRSERSLLRRGFPADRYAAAFSPDAVDVDRLPAGFDPSGGLPGTDATGFLEHGDTIDLGGRVLEVIHTPGHSPGGVSFHDRQARALFVGDLLYHGRMYVFLPTSDPAEFRSSLQRVVALADEVDVVYPAHGPAPLRPEDMFAIRDAFEEVWSGRPASNEDELFALPVKVYDFGQFSFLLAPNTRLGEAPR